MSEEFYGIIYFVNMIEHIVAAFIESTCLKIWYIFCIFQCIFALFCLLLQFSEMISFAPLLSYHTIYIQGRIQALFEIGNRSKIGAQILIDQLKI